VSDIPPQIQKVMNDCETKNTNERISENYIIKSDKDDMDKHNNLTNNDHDKNADILGDPLTI